VDGAPKRGQLVAGLVIIIALVQPPPLGIVHVGPGRSRGRRSMVARAIL
jgi:hypothetical protein